MKNSSYERRSFYGQSVNFLLQYLKPRIHKVDAQTPFFEQVPRHYKLYGHRCRTQL